MRGRSLILLALITVAVVAAAVIVTWVRAPRSSLERELLFPDLGKHVNDVAALRIEGGGKNLSLIRQQGKWVVQEGDGYPVLMDRVKQVVVGVAELRIAAIKTSSPELYSRLGVEDLSARNAASMLLTLQDESRQPVASLIVGKPRRSGAPEDRPGLYVRLSGTQQALLVDGRLDVSAELSDWFDRQLFDIPATRIREIRIQHADGTVLRVARPQPGTDLAVADLPKGNDLQSNVTVSRMGTVLEGFFAEGVRSAAKLDFPDDATNVTVTTFDGLVANISAAKIDDKPFAKFAFSFDAAAAPAKPAQVPAETPATGGVEAKPPEGPDVAGEAQKLQGVLNGWAFQVPQFKFELLNQRLEDLIRVAPKAQAQPAESEEDLPPLPANSENPPPLPEQP